MQPSNPTPSACAQEQLQTLLSRADIWRASAIIGARHNHSGHISGADGVDTGYQRLNQLLIANGWPVNGMVELYGPSPGFGEWQLLLPALTGRYIALIGPPHIPYAPALKKAGIDLRRLLVICPSDHSGVLWAAEQVLRSGSCGALLLWEPERVFQYRELRKLQLAASESACLFFLLRTWRSTLPASPAVLRLSLKPEPHSLALTIVKQRGSYGQHSLCLPVPAAWQVLPALSRMPVALTRHLNLTPVKKVVKSSRWSR